MVAAGLLLATSTSIPPLLCAGPSWQLTQTMLGPKFDRKSAMTTTVVYIEVARPVSAPPDSSWFEPIVTYTPVSVTIALRSPDVARAKCSPVAPNRGSLPTVGGYLMGIDFAVHLTEPLAGRALFDGSTSPPQARPY